MGKAARAIIIENGKLLVMRRNKYGSEYYTLIGGRVNDGETIEQALVREIREETGLAITAGRPVFIEHHAAPFNDQYIYICEIAPHADVAIQSYSEEATMNQYDMNTHTPLWVEAKAFMHLPFRTPQLQAAIDQALRKGFPKEPLTLS